MIELPSFERAWDYENGFYLTCGVARLGKLLAQYEMYKLIEGLPGAVVECGVFKGCSLARFAIFRELAGCTSSQPLIAFDTYGCYPAAAFAADAEPRRRFLAAAGSDSISSAQLTTVLRHKGVASNVELVEGDITRTVPEYVDANPGLAIALVNLDTDLYEPAVTILEHLYPRIVPGGLLLVDDYETFPGERKAVDEFLGGGVPLHRPVLPNGPYYVVKP